MDYELIYNILKGSYYFIESNAFDYFKLYNKQVLDKDYYKHYNYRYFRSKTDYRLCIIISITTSHILFGYNKIPGGITKEEFFDLLDLEGKKEFLYLCPLLERPL